ncbi:cyclic nucleotide-binding domain-containing protein 2-like isoform X1 [Littorina saxatilis]|uniref:cyclic nucleotide-binding domain-containing protein 2-like isoform X1 n=1 Tax=Littorina saxatilis TaxID=31220 RepID=UPI0038B5342C
MNTSAGTNGNMKEITNGGRSDMKELTNGSAADPPETDLDYYARPENYGGSSLHTLQRFIIAHDKQTKGQKKSKKKKNRREEDELLRRYRHILAFDESLQFSSSSSEDEEESRVHSTTRSAVANANNNVSKSRRSSKSVALAVAEAQRPISDCQRTSDTDRPVEVDRRSTSASDDINSYSVTQKDSPQDDTSRRTLADSTLNSDTSLTSSTATLTPSRKTSGEETGSGRETPLDTVGSFGVSSTKKIWARALDKNRFAALSAEVRRNEIRRKFSQAIKAVMTICKLASIMIKKSEEPSAMLKTFTDMIDSNNFTENLKNQGLSFDPSYFKANKEISISNEVKSILNMPPASRSQEQIQTAMYGLQSLPSFAEYPLHMQEKLAKVAWYEVVPPKRTIIRQGHYAENFYFILSGRAVVTILIRDPKTNESQVRTANFMRKGTSFGELALLHHSRRTATVTSQDTVQLLSIGREDFFDIFMSRQGSDEVPEHIRFISQLDFMKGWPLERLLERPEHCLLNFFKRNMVIVKDSKESDWIYVIKSGSCEVLKQLNGVTPRLGIRKHEATLDESFHLPHTGTSIRGPKVDTGLQRPRPQSNRSPPGSLLTTEDEDYFHLWGLAGTGRNSTQSSRSSPKTPIGGTSATPKATSLNNKRYSKESYSDKPLTGRPHFELKTPAASSPRVSPLRLSGPRKQRPSSDSPTGSKPRSVPGSDVPRPPGTPPPVFVRVSTQKPRDIFGLEQIRFHGNLDAQQTSVSLVSRGAECIMLSKDFFRRHANEMVKKNLQELVRPYPDEDTFQDSLQTKADWDLFKHTLIEDITSPPVI